MSLLVCPSCRMRLAVAMRTLSSTFRGRPNRVPLARDTARFNAVRSLTSSRSYSAREPRTPIIMRPAGVDESMPSVTDTRVTPPPVKTFTVSRMWRVLRPSRSNFQTTTVSPPRTYAISSARPGRSSRAPDMVSENVLITPAASKAAFCCSSVSLARVMGPEASPVSCTPRYV